MNTNIIEINKHPDTCPQVSATLSFRPLAAYLKRRLKTEETLKKEFYRFLLEKLEQQDALEKDIDVASLGKHREVLDLIFTILTPLMANEKELFWALSTPIPDRIFYSTDLFHDFFVANMPDKKALKGDDFHKHHEKEQQLRYIYSLILERLYNFTALANSEMLVNHRDKNTGLNRYFRVTADMQFVQIYYMGGELPAIDFDRFSNLGKDGLELETLAKILPLQDFKFDGFTVISLVDVSQQHALEGIRNALANHVYSTGEYTEVIEVLRTLVNNPEIGFGLLPLTTVNDKPVLDNQNNSSSTLIKASKEYGISEELFLTELEKYVNNPKPLFFHASKDLASQEPMAAAIYHSGIKTYAILPIYYNTQLVGLLEIFSKSDIQIDEKLLARLNQAMPLLGQLFQYRIEEFNVRMDEILKDKFTAIQPSVQWKFNQHIWDFMRKNGGNKAKQDIETVTFKHLYPLFGAIDIRNSTIERNTALREDLLVLLDKLGSTLEELRHTMKLELIDKVIFDCGNWQDKVSSYLGSGEENALNEFLEFEVHPMLKHLSATEEKVSPIVNNYLTAIDPEKGIAFENRRKLETSMQMINSAVGEYLEGEQQRLQQTYPFYFAKFRTDGIEYDIYIGQEIAPNTAFAPLYLKNIRLWQLQSMVEIARLTQDLVPKMDKPLQTTQLIFVHSNPIDISFRNDERRFDVEGAYNIRYEVIKKRIDKVRVRNSNERLTQPGKIALVYYNNFEASEYMAHIAYLQEQGSLLSEVEQLELEDLQGVRGLKALRISIAGL